MATAANTSGQPNNYGITIPGTNGTGNVDTRVGTTGQTLSSGTSSQSGTVNSSGTSTTNSSSRTENLSPQAIAELNVLIQQLINGGTPEMRQDRLVRQGERTAVEGMRSGYSKTAAFADATGLMNQQSRRLLEQLLPSINRAAEDAGSSGGALRALLLQDAGNKAAESASALGAKQATDYGNISANFSQVLEALTRPDNTLITSLLNAFNVLKGAVVSTTGTSTTNTTGTQTSSQTGSTTNNTQTGENRNIDYAPFQTGSTQANGFGSGGVQAGRSTAPVYFGPAGNDSNSLSNDLISLLSTQRAFEGFQIN
jgi:hypothetical protein